MRDAREALFRHKSIYDLAGTEPLFIRAVRENVAHHRDSCPFYADLLANRGFDPACIRSVDDCSRIPVIPASYFKYHVALSIPEDDASVYATSSGTQGQKTQMYFDDATLGMGVRMITRIMGYYGFISPWPVHYIMLGYEPSDGNPMGSAQTAMGVTRFAPALGRTFVLRHTPSGYEVDAFGVLRALARCQRSGFPVRLVGFPAYLHMLLTRLRDAGLAFRFPKRSLILLGGGWKQHDDSAVAKDELYAMAEEYLGIPPERCRDFYSAVEHPMAYAECGRHHMHVPIGSRVIIRDVRTLAPVGYDTPGFLSFITPLVMSAPLTSVLMGDLAVLRDGRDCGCGIDAPYFEVIGRAGTSRLRSCAVAASEWMGGSHAQSD